MCKKKTLFCANTANTCSTLQDDFSRPHNFIEKSPYFVPVRMRRQKFTSVDSVLWVRLDWYLNFDKSRIIHTVNEYRINIIRQCKNVSFSNYLVKQWMENSLKHGYIHTQAGPCTHVHLTAKIPSSWLVCINYNLFV